MHPALEAPLNAVSLRLRRLGVLEFLTWWRDELIELLPLRWREWLKREPDVLVIEALDAERVVVRANGRDADAIEIVLNEDAGAPAPPIERLRAGLDDRAAPLIWCLAAPQVLARRLSFPAAVEPNLRQVLQFEMDRQTPFKADQVYFDYVVRQRSDVDKTLDVDLVLALRTQVDPLLTSLRKRIVEPLAGIDARRSDGSRWGINLLPPAQRPRRSHFWLTVNLVLAALALLLVWVVMVQANARKAEAIDRLTTEIEAVREDARAAAELRQQLDDARQASSFLARRRAETPAFLDVLEDVTRLLPEDVWLERMMIAQDELQLQGQAKESSKLINLLTQSKLLSNPQMRGPVQVDPRTGKERFSIAATQKKREAAAPPKTPPAGAANGQAAG
jgi:general secretion pathway protein L